MPKVLSVVCFLLLPAMSQSALAENIGLSFFVTSIGPGNGGNLGGLAGADTHCQRLASAVGAGDRNWKAYLSTAKAQGNSQGNARDRIGTGPWYNANGVLVASNVDDLHSNNNRLNKENSITEKGSVINGRGDKPNMHDILTGSLPNGIAPSAEDDTTCSNWSSAGKGSAIVGHHDRKGGNNRTSWNSAHESFGCSQEKLKITGGNGLFYCVAAD